MARLMSQKKMVETGWAKDIAEAKAKHDYWKKLTRSEKDYFLSLPGTEGDSRQDRLMGAVCEAYTRSPAMRAKRDIERNSYYSEMLECSRTGEMVARKNGVMVGDTFTSFNALSDAEAQFLGVERSS